MDLSSVYDAVPSIITKVVAHYSGENDEGYINEVTVEPAIEGLELSDETERAVEDAAYAILEAKFPGWEINEGSIGTITFDIANRKAHLHHGETVESQNWHDLEV